MLSQEELDKLLEEGGGDDQSNDPKETKNTQDSGSDKAEEGTSPVSQDDLDKIFDQESPTEGKEDASGVTGDNAEGGDLDWSDAFAEAAAGGDAAAAKAMQEAQPEEKPQAATPEFSDFGKTASPTSSHVDSRPNLDFIMDLPLEVSVELGRARMQIRDLLQLAQGSVIELNKMAGEPAEIYVNQKLMAKGEVVVVNEKFGIRLTEIISPADRVKSLG